MKSKRHLWFLFGILLFGALTGRLIGSDSSECLRLYRTALLTGREVGPFDRVKMRAWVEAQPVELRPFAEMLTRRYELISIAAFTDHVMAATLQLLAEIPKEKLVFVYLNKGALYKSGAWVTGIIYEKFPELRTVPAVDWAGADFRRDRCAEPPCVYVYVDDAAYSGEQAALALIQIAGKLRLEVGNAARIIALIPAVTQLAKLSFESINTPSLNNLQSDFWPDPKIRVLFSHRMKNLAEIAAEENMVIADYFAHSLDTTLTYFGHKVADSVSTLSFFSLGAVLQRRGSVYVRDGTIDNFRFIPIVSPPYAIRIDSIRP